MLVFINNKCMCCAKTSTTLSFVIFRAKLGFMFEIVFELIVELKRSKESVV